MNLKINKEQFLELQDRGIAAYIMGSKLYGTNDENSDTDYMCFYKPYDLPLGYPNIHQMQYTEDGVDYIFTTRKQFWNNQRSGDSTINSDLLLFNEKAAHDLAKEEDPLKMCRTYNVIKSYLGFAKRDLKMIDKSSKDKLFHAYRGLYTAGQLILNELPTVEGIKKIKEECASVNISDLSIWEKDLRKEVNDLYDKGEIERYYMPKYLEGIPKLIIESNNTKEFRYD